MKPEAGSREARDFNKKDTEEGPGIRSGGSGCAGLNPEDTEATQRETLECGAFLVGH